MKKSQLILITSLLALLLIIIPFPSLITDLEPSLKKTANGEKIKAGQETEQDAVQVAVFGDIMMHGPQIISGKKGNDYDFTPFFQEVKPYLESADLAVGNLELVTGGPSIPYNGYPTFNSPDEIIDALLKSGVDAVSTANNHAMDQREPGLLRTHKVLKEKGLKGFGTAPNNSERNKPLIIEKNGIKIAFLAYTQTTNGIPVPKPYLVNRIELPLIQKDIQKAKEMGAEFISVSLHWGDEYQRQPNGFQKKTAQEVLKAGADVIVGSHPHVIQPMEKVKVDGKEKLIIYSLGNFVSNQTDPYTQEGLIVYYNIERDKATREVKLKDFSFLPTYSYIYQAGGKKQYRILPLEKGAPDQLPNYPGLTQAAWRKAYQNTYQHMTQNESYPTFSLK